jgi:hypothetical protein
VTDAAGHWAVTAAGFQPGEVVSATVYSTPRSLGQQIADEAGQVTFQWTMSADEAGQHRLVLTGPQSGEVVQHFTVAPTDTVSASSTNSAPAPAATSYQTSEKPAALSQTGASAHPWAVVVAVLALVLGAVGLTVSRRLKRRSTI